MSTNNQRIRRDTRAENPHPIRLTDRDLDVIQAVYDYRVLTTEQLQKLFFPSMHRTYERLAALYHHGYLDRRFLGVYTAMMNTPILYVLDKRGAEALQSHRGMDISWSGDLKEVGLQFLEHTLAINTVRVMVTLACRQHSDFELTGWMSESDLKADYDYVNILTPKGRRESVSLIPDGYFAIQTPKGTAHFFLELDRGTMTGKRYKQKVLAYLAYARSGLADERFGTQRYRVLTVTESAKRAENLKVATEDVGGENRFWFGVLSELTAEAILTEPLWTVAGRDDPSILIN